MKFKNSLISLVVANACCSIAWAQEVKPNSDSEVEVITVTGIRASAAAAMDKKRESSGFADALVAEDISAFPDLNLSEALQRIPGVAITRQNGEGQSVTVRALGPEFTQVRLNGQTVTSAGGRSVDLDMFASELIQSVVLKKSPDAASTEGGLAATIDMQTRKPFDQEGFVAAGSLQGQENSLAEEKDPRVSFLLSNTWGEKFGALISVAKSDYTIRQDAIENILWEIDKLGGGTSDAMEIPFLPRAINEFRDRERTGITTSFQYRPTETIGINFDVVSANFDELRRRYTIDTLFFDGSPVPISPITVPGIGGIDRVVGGTFSNVQSRSENVFDDIDEKLNIYNLQGSWKVNSSLEVSAQLGYSKAEQYADLFRVLYDFRGNATLGEAQYKGVTVPTFRSDDYSFTDPLAYKFNQLRYLIDDIEDNEKSAQLDVTYYVDWGVFSSLKTGFRYAEHNYVRLAYDERVNPSKDNPAPEFAQIATLNYGLMDGKAPKGVPSEWLVVERDIFSKNQSVVPDNFTPAFSYPSTFDIGEDTLAGYVQLDIDADAWNRPVRGNIGIRAVETDQTSLGYVVKANGVGTIVEESSYTDVLPSLNLVMDMTDEVVLRFAASKAITRPTISQLSPGISSYDIGSMTARQGNPKLDPFRVTQIDIGAEYYFADESLISLTGFFKDVESFISETTESKVLDFGGPLYADNGTDISKNPFIVSLPINGKGAKIKGFEFIYQQPFTFLPIEGFGMMANYTYAKTDGVKVTYGGVKFETPFVGSSENSYNLTGYYELDKLNVRLAYAWRDAYVESSRGDSQTTYFVDSYGQLDMSAGYSITDNIDVTLDVLNLTDEVVSRYGLTKERSIGAYDYGRTVVVGIKAAF